MPKATLEYDLPDEENEFKLANDGFSWYEVSLEMEGYLRSELEYHTDNYTAKQLSLLEDIRSKLHELISEEVGIDSIHNY